MSSHCLWQLDTNLAIAVAIVQVGHKHSLLLVYIIVDALRAVTIVHGVHISSTNLKFSWFGSLATSTVADNAAVASFI